MTKQELMIAALLARGEKELISTTHYRVFTRTFMLDRNADGTLNPVALTAAVHGKKWYVGKAGALRTGFKASDTIPVSDDKKALLIGEGRTASLRKAAELPASAVVQSEWTCRKCGIRNEPPRTHCTNCDAHQH